VYPFQIVKIGLNYAPIRRNDQPRAAVLADQLGYASLWYGEHVALPYDFDPSKYPGESMTFDPDSIILDPFALLAYVAGITEHVRLGTGIAILPLHDPLLTARTLVTIDMVSRGRIDLGVGVGWNVDEFEFLGRDFRKRGEILDEFLAVLDVLWREPRPEHHGKHFDFRPIGFRPKPVQRPRIPVHVGGRGPVSLRRAARYDGWYGAADTPADAARVLAEIQGYREHAGTDGSPFEFSVLLFRAPDKAEVEAYEAAGVDQLVVTPWVIREPSDALRRIEEYAVEIGLTPPPSNPAGPHAS
jgi:probable F420-dependent oxidoreductase